MPRKRVRVMVPGEEHRLEQERRDAEKCDRLMPGLRARLAGQTPWTVVRMHVAITLRGVTTMVQYNIRLRHIWHVAGTLWSRQFPLISRF